MLSSVFDIYVYVLYKLYKNCSYIISIYILEGRQSNLVHCHVLPQAKERCHIDVVKNIPTEKHTQQVHSSLSDK